MMKKTISRYNHLIVLILLSGVLLVTLETSRNLFKSIQNENSLLMNQEVVPLYLPKLEAVKKITLGYEHFASSLLWFTTLHYFGSQFEAKKSMPWFGHMCELVTELDPRARHVFEFCGTLLSWIAREPKRCIQLLTKGIENDPEHWRYYYLRGFTYWYFLEDMERARHDLVYASKIKEAPLFLSSLAARLISTHDDIGNAISFLKASIENTEDLNAKAALEERLQLAYVSNDIRRLMRLIQNYEGVYQKKPESLLRLVEEGYLSEVPLDPFGEAYLYDSNSGEIVSTQGKKGLHFAGKTAKTGFAKKEGWVSNED
jgi:hypothetical protein